MSDTAADDQRERRLQGTVFPLLPTFPIVPAHAALLIIDMQRRYADPEDGDGLRAREAGVFDALRPYFDRLPTVIANVARLRVAARAAGVEVIHIRTVSGTTDGRDCLPLGPVRPAACFSPASSESEFVPELAPGAGDMAIAKITSSAFIATSLELVLQRLARDTLICCGVPTDGAVEGTVRDARDLGFRPIVVSDGCAAWTDARHDASLRYLARGRGNVRSAADLVAALESTRGVPA